MLVGLTFNSMFADEYVNGGIPDNCGNTLLKLSIKHCLSAYCNCLFGASVYSQHNFVFFCFRNKTICSKIINNTYINKTFMFVKPELGPLLLYLGAKYNTAPSPVIWVYF